MLQILAGSEMEAKTVPNSASHNRRLMLNRFAVAGDSPTAAAQHNLQPNYAKRLA